MRNLLGVRTLHLGVPIPPAWVQGMTSEQESITQACLRLKTMDIPGVNVHAAGDATWVGKSALAYVRMTWIKGRGLSTYLQAHKFDAGDLRLGAYLRLERVVLLREVCEAWWVAYQMERL